MGQSSWEGFSAVSFFFLTEIYLVYNITLVSSVEQSDSVIHMCTHTHTHTQHIYIHTNTYTFGVSWVAHLVKNPPAMCETPV